MTDEIPKMFTDTGLSPVARDKSKRTASLASSGHQEDFGEAGKSVHGPGFLSSSILVFLLVL